MTIEVGEHLPAECAKTFVKSLTNCSDIILFSAAAPYHGGRLHYNEQPPGYWCTLFNENDYECFDFMRDILWNKEDVSHVHRQNILVFAKKGKTKVFEDQGFKINNNPQFKYHPGLFETRFKKLCRNQALKNTVFLFFKRLLPKHTCIIGHRKDKSSSAQN